MNRVQIGRRIGQCRTRMGLSTMELARRIGKSQATISRIENGKQNVTLELLATIARTLRIHPFALLSDMPLRHSVLLPPAAVRSDSPMRILARTLQAARLHTRVDLSTAAGHLGLGVDELEAIEMGYALPDTETLELMADLYGAELALLSELADLERTFPRISERMAVLQHYLAALRQELRQQAPLVSSAPELKRLYDDLTRFLEEPYLATAKQTDAFAINHLTDCLLDALQNPEFHERIERLAREWRQAKETPRDQSIQTQAFPH